MITFVFWFLAALMLYLYIGYPLILYLISRIRPDRESDAVDQCHAVTLIISAYNEEDCIAEKLDNCLELDYPRELLQIIVVSDQSSDRTDEIVAGYAEQGIELLRMEERGGKTLGLNAAVAKSCGEYLVFSDANAMYRPDAIRALTAPFADSQVGAVVGEASYAEADSDAGESESLYWRYETAIKILESRVSSVVGGDGAIYAVRRSLFKPMGADVLSDFVNPLQVIEQGSRCVYDPRAVSVEHAAGSFEKEFGRKVRIVNRAWRATMSMKQLLNPFRFGLFAWQLISHKLLRWIAPAFLVALFVTNLLILGEGWVYSVTLVLQTGFYCLAMIGAVLWKRTELALIFYVPFYFCLVNIASARGIVEAYGGRTYATWSTARTGDRAGSGRSQNEEKQN